MVSAKCIFFFGPEVQLGKFRMGGNPEGTVDIYDDHIDIFKKSRAVAILFGAIGSAMAGKGKAETSILKSSVMNYRSDNKGSYWLYLQGGNVLYIDLMGFSTKPAQAAMLSFLMEIPVKP